MSEQEKKDFLEDVWYFWTEKGDIERLVGFSMEKLEEASPVLAHYYQRLKLAEKNFNMWVEEVTNA